MGALKPTYLIVAGGSGGHLVPAVALAEHLQRTARCVLVSTARPVDRLMSEGSGVEWVRVDLKPVRPSLRWLWPGYWVGQWKGFQRIRQVIRKERPAAAIGFGGYISAVALVAAKLARLPVVIHEQNVLPGGANRLLARFADAVAVHFKETGEHLPRGCRVEVTGNPLRTFQGKVTVREARQFFGLESEEPVLLVMGGSQGSRAVNDAILKMWEARAGFDEPGMQVIHLCGSEDPEKLREAYRLLGVPARVFPFLREMEMAYAAATLAVSRAGATTISELSAVRLPAVLIPYPHAGGHQRANARWLAQRQGAIVVEQSELAPYDLWKRINALIRSPRRLEEMRQAMTGITNGTPAVEKLARLVEKVVKGRER
ncbi:MAG: undecaprenyldiphospho-muramoylpentapeptide beta-N-acetylglucosaminyltransferase [Candidatus Omnitrophica bacterium]|nr:undecaprenyldiphospho-muramoylpentapeptide beta-N-acetylglucosaminyltransferase [Candidatus Omnitrophota bacterium]